MTTADQGRRRLRIFAFTIALGFGAIAVVNWWSTRENLREGSKLVSEGGERMTIEKIPTTYRAVFRSENRAQGQLTVTTEKVWVKRPFASRIENYDGAAAVGRPSTVRQSILGTLASESRGSSSPLNIAVPPSVASGDVRPDAVLAEAVESKIMLVREQREVYGRRCQVYRSGGSMLAGDVTPYEPGKGDYADICIDPNGIIIEEYWVRDGELIRRRVATELEVGVSIERERFDIEVEETPGVNRGAVVRITDPAGDEGLPLWTLGEPPKGFDRLGRYAVALSPDAVPNLGGEPPPVGPTSTTDVYVRGPDIVVIDQDPSLQLLASFEGRPTRDVDLEGLRNGKLIVDARMSEVRGETGDGSFVRIFGTLATDELLDLANRLRPPE